MLTYCFTPLDYSTASGVIQWSNPEVKMFTFFFVFVYRHSHNTSANTDQTLQKTTNYSGQHHTRTHTHTHTHTHARARTDAQGQRQTDDDTRTTTPILVCGSPPTGPPRYHEQSGTTGTTRQTRNAHTHTHTLVLKTAKKSARDSNTCESSEGFLFGTETSRLW